MISYIVIGRNEGWKLKLCLKSVQESIRYNKYINSEVVYVDSASTDESIEIAKSYDSIKIYKLIADYNAPIARNLGASKASGDILFFIDGDMEIEPDFLVNVLNRNGELCYGFIGGYYIGRYYNANWDFLYEKRMPIRSKSRDYFQAFTGGLFIISKQYWDLVEGMKPYLTGGADPDIALRLAKKGILKLWIDKPMAKHYTRIGVRQAPNIRYLLSERSLRGRILVVRENLLTNHALKRMIRIEYSSFILLFSFLGFILNKGIGFYSLLGYLVIIVVKGIKRDIFKSLLVIIVKDFIFILGMIFYWPSRKVNIKYLRIS